MTQIGALEAETHLPELLEEVRQGASFVITLHGNPVAELIPVRRTDPNRVRKVIAGLKRFQEGHSLNGLSVDDMIEEGRRTDSAGS